MEGSIKFTTEQKSSEHLLRVSLGDEITAKHIDKTLPSPYSVGEELEIVTIARLKETVVP